MNNDQLMIPDIMFYDKSATVTYNIENPDPYLLEVIGGVIPVTNRVTFPPKWFNKNAVITITPVLRYEGGEELGFSYICQGEYIKGTNEVISWNANNNSSLGFKLTNKK